MNYNMQGITETIPKLFVMFDTAKVEIKKEHQLLMVSETTSFKKGKVKVETKPETKCFCNEGNGH